MLALSLLPEEVWNSHCPQATASDTEGLFLRGGYFQDCCPQRASHPSCSCSCCPSGTCQLHVPFSHHCSRFMSPQALYTVLRAAAGCFLMSWALWTLSSTTCLSWNTSLGSPKLHWYSSPISIKPGSEPPTHLSGVGGGGERRQWTGIWGRRAVSLETEPTAFLTEPL